MRAEPCDWYWCPYERDPADPLPTSYPRPSAMWDTVNKQWSVSQEVGSLQTPNLQSFDLRLWPQEPWEINLLFVNHPSVLVYNSLDGLSHFLINRCSNRRSKQMINWRIHTCWESTLLKESQVLRWFPANLYRNPEVENLFHWAFFSVTMSRKAPSCGILCSPSGRWTSQDPGAALICKSLVPWTYLGKKKKLSSICTEGGMLLNIKNRINHFIYENLWGQREFLSWLRAQVSNNCNCLFTVYWVPSVSCPCL